MAYLACMIIGSMVTIACACMCAAGKDDKPKTIFIHSGHYLYEVVEATGEVVCLYEYKEGDKYGEVVCLYEYKEGDKYGDIYEKRELK